MNYIEQKILNKLHKREWNKVVEHQYEKDRERYNFVELFVHLFNQLTQVSVIDKKTLEDVLSCYCDDQEFKSLFENITINDEMGKHVDLKNSIVTKNGNNLFEVSKGGRTYISLVDITKASDIIDSYDSSTVSLMSKLIMKLYIL